MSTAELIMSLKNVTGDELRKELATCKEAREQYLRETDREIALIEGLIDVVEPKASEKMDTKGNWNSWPKVTPCRQLIPPVDPPNTSAVEVSREEVIQSNPAKVLGTLSQAIQPALKPKRKKIETLLAKVVTAKDIRTYLDVAGPTAAGAIAHQFNCLRESITDILETDSQFVTDDRGFWDLRSKVTERREKELQPIEQVH